MTFDSTRTTGDLACEGTKGGPDGVERYMTAPRLAAMLVAAARLFLGAAADPRG
jgi:hypothetical protein